MTGNTEYNGIVHWDSKFKKVYTYGLYKGSTQGYSDWFNGYNKSYEQHNVFLGDSYVSSKEQTFQRLCEESVKNMTCTEAILRLGFEFSVTDMMNDYFKFVKDYEGQNTDLAHNKKDTYFTSDDEEHKSDSQTSITMLNRNNLWKGTVTYTYSMKDGFKVSTLNGTVKESGEGTKDTPPKEGTLLGDNAFDDISRKEDEEKKDKDKGEGYFEDGYEPKSELSKYLDATNFDKSQKEDIYKAYKWDTKNSYDSDPKEDTSEKKYVENLKHHVDDNANKHLTDFYDWSWISLKIWDDAHNGTRDFKSTIHYEIVENENLNIEDDKKYTNYTENGSLGTAVNDTNQKSEEIGLTDESFDPQKGDISKCVKVNILSPVSITNARIYTTDLINPTDIQVGSDSMVVEDGGTIYLQKNAQFIIEFRNENEQNNAEVSFGKDSMPEGVYTKKYIREYWVKLSFDCYYNGRFYTAGTYIRSESLEAFVARTTENYNGEGEGIVEIGENSIEVVAVAINMPFPDTRMPTSNTYKFAKASSETTENILNAGQIDKLKNKARTGSSVANHITTSSTDDAYHAANKKWTAKGIFRIFGFEITDFKDIEYKNIFRKNATDEYANSGNYFAGRYEWAYSILSGNRSEDLIYHSSNEMLDRLSAPDKFGGGYVLPVGPKSQKNGYEYAPKLGYRFSFNVKTTGATTEEVTIVPSYYYISKDGNTYKKDINLYYKDGNGVYKKFENYNIYFKPDDGYRYLRFISGDSSTSENLLSKDLQSIEISKEFTLKKDGFSTTDYKGYVQVWYGEFKLPNSTIAVEKGGNLNNPLTNGYIGVKFEITCKNSNENTAEYSKSINGENTSQWDFEGNFGFRDAGKGTNGFTYNNWNIDNSTWQDVKSTVVLYDTDLRAEDDFQ